ncbi:MAG TPA: RNA polymerase recycling motor HelD [Tetragenococcus sp.]|nr:RNA polymerase recycling motor HelD [Tetragenococcus sp.]
MNQEEDFLADQQQLLQKKMNEEVAEINTHKINIGSEESFYESATEYRQYEQELQLRYQSAQAKDKRLNTLQTMADNPYFARIDFKEGNDQPETLYLGIAALRDQKENTIMIDWRAPIANLYYEGELGPATYRANKETFKVELLLKRQFNIQKKKIISMVDTSEMINDEFLLDILDSTSSNRMKNIVSTIQKAQNKIIRDTDSKIMLVEGIAGSGKTSALLQRIAFLLYHHREWLKTEQVLLFSPNHLFTDYISLVLPSLGESEIPTQTFTSFLEKMLPEFQIHNTTQEEEQFLNEESRPVQKLKNSLALVDQIDPYIDNITAWGPLFRDIKIKNEVYISKTQIRQWYQNTNPNLPLYQRTQLLQEQLFNKLAQLQKNESKKDWVKQAALEKLEEIYENNPDIEDSDKKERQLTKQLKEQLAKKKFRPLRRQIQQFRFINLKKQYLHFLSQADHTLADNLWLKSIQEVKNLLKNRQLLQEDALLYLLLARKLYPLKNTAKIRFIFIDEMQDFPPAQVALLKQLFPKARMTLCGDLNQKVFSNDSIVKSMQELFKEQKITHHQLTTSYRSTEEITNFANQFLSQEDQVKTTARKGKLPIFVQKDQLKEAVGWLENDLQQLSVPSQWRIAIIAKNSQACKELYQELTAEHKKQIQLITSEDDFIKRKQIIIPAYLAKGLEFDKVYACYQEEDYSKQDKLVFYTMATRAMHELTVINYGKKSLLFETMDPQTYQN